MGDPNEKDPRADKELGMDRGISRRDFLNGVAFTAGASVLPPHLLAAVPQDLDPEKAADYYPPALTGLRGSHVGAFETAHSVRDGDFWQNAPTPIETGEKLDLIIVGGGISGLSAAHFFRKANPGARILIIENHDDFGGHAKRNEFTVGNRKLLGYGGTFAIESPAPYSAVAQALIKELGIDVPSYSQHVASHLYRSNGLSPGVFFNKETFGSDVLTVNPLPIGGSESEEDKEADSEKAWKRFTAEAPLNAAAKRDLLRLRNDQTDYYPGLGSEEKKARLARISYANYLTEVAKADPEIVKFYQTAPHGLFGVGIDAVSAQDAWGLGFLGFKGLKLQPGAGKGMNRDAIPNEEAEKYFFHFPDGNATIARLLVRSLIPEAIPGSSVDDIVTARADYAKLDASLPVRIRLNSTAVRVKHLGDPASAKEVEITYSRFGKLYTVRAPHAVLACWNMVIPYICSELPEQQKAALHSAAKVPLLYTNVTIRNWSAFQKLGASSVYAPGCYHTGLSLDLPVSIGDYHCSSAPDQPIVVHMMKTPCKPGLPARDQHRMGRIELFVTDFEVMERKIREQLARTLSAGGFDPARDITAITVNRWPHGYAYEYNSLWDKFWLEGGEIPCEVARQPFGRITIANADAGAYAYTDGAIDQAWRAVQDLQKV